MRVPGQATWSVGTCKAMVGLRSYEILIGNTTYRRNRHHLLCTNEPPDNHSTTLDQQTEDMAVERNNINEQESTSSTAAPMQMLHRSQRTHRPPRWMEDYVPL